jgi:hypothetical protein
MRRRGNLREPEAFVNHFSGSILFCFKNFHLQEPVQERTLGDGDAHLGKEEGKGAGPVKLNDSVADCVCSHGKTLGDGGSIRAGRGFEVVLRFRNLMQPESQNMLRSYLMFYRPK